MLTVAIDNAKITRLQNKFKDYGPFAIKKGLEAASDYLNSPDVKASMYPQKSSAPFVWSSEKQRRAYFATNGFGGGIPYQRTMMLYEMGKFTVNPKSFWVEYSNSMPYYKWVIHPTYQIIGHKIRRWPLITRFTTAQSSKVVSDFKKAAVSAWELMDSLMYGGGFGL